MPPRLGLSRHSSRQNGEKDCPKWRNSGYWAKPKTRQGQVFLVNASQIFEKGDPKNFIPEAGIQRIADTLIGWKEEEKLSRIVDHAELKKNDYNISPSRYIHTGDAETYRPIGEIVAELNAIEVEAGETDKALREILEKIGV
jgi:type I restriction enzyme M protein